MNEHIIQKYADAFARAEQGVEAMHRKEDEAYEYMKGDAWPECQKNDRADGKLRWELLPLETIEQVVRVYTFGAEKYAPDSWQNLDDGYRRYKAALMRHIVAHEKGEMVDDESGILHLAHAAWNAIAMLHIVMNEKTEISNGLLQTDTIGR